MTFDARPIRDEYDRTGRVSEASRRLIEDAIVHERSARAMTLAADLELVGLADAVARAAQECDEPDEYVAGAAISVLLFRFVLPEYVPLGLRFARRDWAAQSDALTGLGHVLPFVEDAGVRREVATLLAESADAADSLVFRPAYVGMLHALGYPPEETMDAVLHTNRREDIDPLVVARFRAEFLG